MTYRCLDCGSDFYGEEPRAEIVDQITEDDQLVDDEEALREAEEEVKRQTEEEMIGDTGNRLTKRCFVGCGSFFTILSNL